MKSAILKLAALSIGLLTIPTHAMLSRASVALWRSSMAAVAGKYMQPALDAHLASRSPSSAHLPARTLAAFHTKSSSDDTYSYRNDKNDNQSEHDESSNNDSNDYNGNRWQNFFKFTSKTTFGLSFLGYRIWWSDDEICQTPEDFHNTEKLQTTREYALAKGNDRIAEVFIEKFNVLKKDSVAKKKVLEFLATSFDSLKDDPQKFQALKQFALEHYKTLHTDGWGKKIIKQVIRHQQEIHGVNRKTTFKEWKQLCDNLPCSNKHFMHSALSRKELLRVVAEYKNYAQKEQKLTDPAYWLGKAPELKKLYGSTFTPYVQKLVVKPGSHIAFHGDLHGDIHALNNFLHHLQKKGYLDENFKIIRNDFYMVFLGDYTDRGYYGAEVWYTILRLKLANKDRVILVRGNHEDKKLNAKYGFDKELKAKFAESTKDSSYQELYNLYNFFPVALYLGCGTEDARDYLQCCHGGLELGFDPRPLFEDKRSLVNTLVLDQHQMIDRSALLGRLSQTTYTAIAKTIPGKHLEPFKVTNPYYMGFMWNDFIINTDKIVGYGSRGWKCGKQLTADLLKAQSTQEHKVRGVFRAHQHFDPEMMARILNRDKKGSADDIGVGKIWTDNAHIKKTGALWNGIVCTFLVAPAIFGKYKEAPFDFDAFGILITAKTFQDWKLKVIRLEEHQDQKPA